MQHTSTWGPPNLKIAYNCAICSRDIIIGTGKSFHCLVYKPIRSPNILMKQALLMLGLRIPDKIQGYAVARESMSWYKTFNWQYFYNLHVYINELGELTNDGYFFVVSPVKIFLTFLFFRSKSRSPILF